MSPKITSLTAGLTALGLCWSATRTVADPPQQAPASAMTPAPSPTVLLLSNGQVVQGQITEDDDGYTYRNNIGQIHYPRHRVEKTFGSIREAYQYKCDRLPKRDPDERMKLALWCLEQKLHPEAKEQLRGVLALSPQNGRAKAMLFQIESAEQFASQADPGVVRTSVESAARADAPGALSMEALREAYARNPEAAQAAPQIFDLPTPLAVRRYQEFARSVHPILQRSCAKCHNEQSDSQFQLIQARSNRDLANELLVRTNLDAVLRLVDRDDPARSELLTSALMPHAPSGKPIFIGPNHPLYRVLDGWVHSREGRADLCGGCGGNPLCPCSPR